MQDFPTKVDGVSSEPAAEYNNLTSELKSVISSLGVSFDSGSIIQLAQAIAAYVATGNMYSESGSSNTFTCTPTIATRKSPGAYYSGMVVMFNATHGNTGAATINVASLGSKDIKKADGSTALSSGDIVTSGLTILWYDGTVFRLQASGVQPTAFTPTAANALSGSIVGVGTAVDKTARSLSVSTGINLSSPATTQGAAYTQLDLAYTPKGVGNKIIIEGMLQVFVPGGNGGNTCMGIWKDADATFLSIGDSGHGDNTGGSVKQVHVYAEMTVASLTAITFRANVSQPEATSNVLVNQVSGSSNFGNKMASYLRVTEVKA